MDERTCWNPSAATITHDTPTHWKKNKVSHEFDCAVMVSRQFVENWGQKWQTDCPYRLVPPLDWAPPRTRYLPVTDVLLKTPAVTLYLVWFTCIMESSWRLPALSSGFSCNNRVVQVLYSTRILRNSLQKCLRLERERRQWCNHYVLLSI